MIFVKISQNFIKSHLKICLISQISVHILWHVCGCAPSEDSDQSVADPEGVRGGCSNHPLSQNYFIFMGNFKKSWIHQ